MKILAIDTANTSLSVAVISEEKLLAQVTTNVGRNHSVNLMPLVDEMLKQSHLTIDAIDRFVVSQGPGSYTGLRIGVTTAKVLADTLNKELVGVSSLKVLAAALPQDTSELLVPLFDARRDNVFAGIYQYQDGELQTVLPDQHIAFTKLCSFLTEKGVKVRFVGADVAHFAEQLAQLDLDYRVSEGNFNYPQAYVLGLLGGKQAPVMIANFVPEYHRLTQAEIQWQESHPEKENDNYVERT